MAQNVAITLGYFIFSKNHNEPPKVAQLAKNHPIWSPCDKVKMNDLFVFVSLGENDSAQKWQF